MWSQSLTMKAWQWCLLGMLGVAYGYPMWCSPRLWEAKEWALHITHTDSGPQIRQVHSQFSVDVIGNRFASLETVEGGGENSTVFNLFYYDANTLFTVRDGRCNTTHIEGNVTQQCINIPSEDAVEYLKESLGGDNAYQLVTAGLRTLSKDGVGCFHSVDIDTPNVPVIREIQGVIAGDHITNEEVRNIFRRKAGQYEDLLTTVRKRQL